MRYREKNIKRNAIIVAILIMTLVVPFVSFGNEDVEDFSEFINIEEISFEENDFSLANEVEYAIENPTDFSSGEVETKDPNEKVEVIVELESPPSNLNKDGDGNLSIQTFGASNFDKQSVKNQILALTENTEPSLRSYGIQSASTPSVNFLYDYNIVMNGFSIEIERKYIDDILEIANVKNAFESNFYEIYVPQGYENYIPGSGQMIGVNGDEASKYTGKGIVIAILDSGIEVNHRAFQGTFETASAKLDRDSISKTSSSLNASASVDNLFKSSKIPFAFDYGDNDTDVKSYAASDAVKSHGIHVAGIASANSDIFKGIAPDSQLLAMKVVSDSDGGARDAAILAALEDAVKLDADIINISLGTGAGFSEASTSSMEDVFRNISSMGINVSASAGNDNNSAALTRFGNGLSFAENPDYSILSSPASYSEPLAVASVINEIIFENGTAQPNPDKAYKMSRFSSWGVTPDLKLKPEITAPGENIFSATANDGFANMNGTSMATPHISGAIALMKEKFELENINFGGISEKDLIFSLLMNTSTPLSDDSGQYYSPRKQGAGIANVNSALKSKSIISVENSVRPKADLGDSENGSFNFKFNVINGSNEILEYKVKPVALSETITFSENHKFFSQNSQNFAGRGINVSISGASGDVVSVPANGSKEISVSISLDGSFASSLKNNFPNGNFIDGFIILESDTEQSLSVPFMGFYGNWSSVPVFDANNYEDKDYLVFESGAYSLAKAEEGKPNPITALGRNKVKLIKDKEAAIEPDRFVLTDRDFSLAVQTGLLRNVKSLKYIIKGEDGEIDSVYYPNVRKTFFRDGKTGIKNAEYYFNPYPMVTPELLDHKEGNYTYSVIANTDGNSEQVWDINFYFDKTAPSIENYYVTYNLKENKKYLYLNLTDNHFIGGFQFADADGKIPLSDLVILKNPNGEIENGNLYKLRVDITNFKDKLVQNNLAINEAGIAVYDYGLNGGVLKLEFNKEFLFEEYSRAISFKSEDYTSDSFKVLTNAIEESAKVLEDNDALKIVIDETLLKLTSAIEQLEKYDGPPIATPTNTPSSEITTNPSATEIITTAPIISATPGITNSDVITRTTPGITNSDVIITSNTPAINSSSTVITSNTPVITNSNTIITSKTPGITNSNVVVVTKTTAATTKQSTSTVTKTSAIIPTRDSSRTPTPTYVASRNTSWTANTKEPTTKTTSTVSLSPSFNPTFSTASPVISKTPTLQTTATETVTKTTPKPTSKPIVQFKDLSGHWAAPYVYELVDLDGISGYPDGTFRPNNKITRAEFITIVVKVFGLEYQGMPNSFSDTKGHWAKSYIDVGYSNGLIRGVSDSNFSPNLQISRQEMAAILSDFIDDVDVKNLSFNDERDIAPWAEDGVYLMTSAGIMTGYNDGTLRPKLSANRGEASTMIISTLNSKYRVIDSDELTD